MKYFRIFLGLNRNLKCPWTLFEKCRLWNRRTTEEQEEWKRATEKGTLTQLIGIGDGSSLGRYVFGSEISYNKAPPRLPGLGC